jgi:hypothetical protein
MLSPILQAQLAPKFLLNSPPHCHNLNTASLRAALLAPGSPTDLGQRHCLAVPTHQRLDIEVGAAMAPGTEYAQPVVVADQVGHKRER